MCVGETIRACNYALIIGDSSLIFHIFMHSKIVLSIQIAELFDWIIWQISKNFDEFL